MNERPTWCERLSQPRARLRWRTHYRHYMFVGLSDVLLLLFGILFVLSPQQPSDRWLGVGMVGVSAVLSAFLGLYLRRPAAGKPHRGFR